MSEVLAVSKMSNREIADMLQKPPFKGIVLEPNEIRYIARTLGRDPTVAELWAHNVEWNEHCGYVSTRKPLRELLIDRGLTSGKSVVSGFGADAGGIHLVTKGDVNYSALFKMESHNHPSQVLPYEGAATGIGGIVRDIETMMAEVLAVLDPLRFGNVYGKYRNVARHIANGVVAGIGGYGNPLGIPNMGGDIVFSNSFNHNCLVNVAAIGIAREHEIIGNKVPSGRKEKYVLIVVGKPTDNSGFGGAAFASKPLDRQAEEKGAIQVPDPFLKEVLFEADRYVLDLIKKKGYKPSQVAHKDFGGGGFYCWSSEIGAGKCGIKADLDKLPISMNDLLPHVLGAAETQERYGWAVPEPLAPDILRIYNEVWALPEIYEGARAAIVGEVTDDNRYVLTHKGEVVCDLPIDFLVGGIAYDRKIIPSKRKSKEPEVREPKNLSEVLLRMLYDPNIASRYPVYSTYDTTVKGNTVIAPGEADAGVLTRPDIYPVGIAAKVDGNPAYGRINPYWGGATAVAEAARNVACVGASPSGISDCLNFGNPTKPVAMWQFREALKGIADASVGIGLKDGSHIPIPSGNVSLYNESKQSGRSVDPSPIILMVGIVDDVSKSITMRLKNPNDRIYLIGERFDELGGSEYYRIIHNRLGANVPVVRFPYERAMIYGVIDAINAGYVKATHDISNGGFLVSLAEMAINKNGGCGAEIDSSLANSDLRNDKNLFSESSGFLLEVPQQYASQFEKTMKSYGIEPRYVGDTTARQRLVVYNGGRDIVNLHLDSMRQVWTKGLRDALR